MKRISIIAAVLALGLAGPADAASLCKGLAQGVCGTTQECGWREALVKGETTTKAGTPAKVNRKAHCAKQRQKTKA